jgi:outer membrane protein TolC
MSAKTTTRTLLCVVMAIAPAVSIGQTSRPLTLEDAVAAANAGNPQILGAAAGEDGASAAVRAARAAVLPRIGVAETAIESTDPVFAFGARLRQGRFTAADFSPQFLNDPGPTSDYMSTAGMDWTVFDSGHARHEIRGAQAALTASLRQADAMAQNVAFATVRAYYRALLADDEKSTTVAAVKRAQAFARETHDRVDAGMALVADAMQADVELSQRQEDETEAESNSVLAYSELAATLGSPSNTFTLTAPLGTPGEVAQTLPVLQQEALQKRPDLLALRSRVVSATERAKASRSAFGPQVATFANVQADNPHPLGGGATNWTVGAKIEFQIFDGGARRAEVSKGSAEAQAARAALKALEIQATLEVQRALYARQTAQRKYAISDAMLSETRESLRTAEDRYRAGLVTVAEVLRQQELLGAMELDRTQALHQWWIASAQLRLATGELVPSTAGVKP